MKKIAFITGAGRGIGKATAIRLAKDGFDIWINYKSNTLAAEKTRNEVTAEGVNCSLLPFDVSNTEETLKILEDKISEAGTPFVLVNNAGITRDGILAMMSGDDWTSVINVHLNGFFNVTRAVLPYMIRKRCGRIINIVSVSGETGVGGQCNYSAAKSGIIGATRSLAMEVAKRGILVNAVSPGFIDTEMLAGLPMENIVKSIPLQRTGRPEEVASVVSFLASEDSSYITGQIISVNGGIHT